MSRTLIAPNAIPVIRPSDAFLAACEQILAERGVDGDVTCLGLVGPGRQFNDGGLRISTLTTGHDAGALDIELTFTAGPGQTVTSPAVQRLPGARLTHVHSHWVYGLERIKQYARKLQAGGPIDNSPYEITAVAA